MAEQDQTMKTGDDPKDFTVDQVNAHLSSADDDERGRVLQAERDGEGRKGILEGPHNPAPQEGSGDETGEPSGLAATGNPNDMAAPSQGNVSADIAHQEGAPEELAKAADDAAEKGYLGETPEKPDYSQANPAVMNQEG